LSRSVLYLTPYPPTRNGIADYALAYRSAIETHTDWRLAVAALGHRTLGNSPRAVLTARRRVREWKRHGLLREVVLVHAEIGIKQHDEFWTLFFLLRQRPGVPCCVTVHDPPLVIAPALYPLACGARWAVVRRALRVFDYTPLGRSVVRSVVGRAACVVVLSNAGRKTLSRLVCDPERLRTLPHLPLGRPRLRRAEGAADRPLKVLFLGFWAPGKGLEVLLEAAARVLSRGAAGVRFLFAGGADDSATNRRYVESVRETIRRSPGSGSFEVMGYVAAEDLDRTFADADVFVVPSIRTACVSTSGVLSRAMAAGLAVVASDVGAVREEIHHLKTGLLVPPGDVGALTEALLLLARDPSLRQRLGREAQSHLEIEHDGARVAQATAQIYEALAKP